MTTQTEAAETQPYPADRLAALEQSVADLARQVDEMAGMSITPAELTVIPGLDVLRPIPIVIEESDEDAIARWIEPAITGIGRSEGQAVDSLREIIVDVWNELRADDVRLSGNARRMLAVMEYYVAPAA